MRSTRTIITGGLFVLAACGGEEPASEMDAPAEAEPAAEEVAAPAETTDLSSVSLPEGVTLQMVQAGREMYPNQVCTACHGPDARGIEQTGPDLLDDTWINSDGTYDAIVQTIMDGVPEPQEHVGIMMPRGGNPSITDEQVRELAAYVYAASRTGAQ